MDPVTHVAGCLLNISGGHLAHPNDNVDRTMELGAEQLIQLEASWPEGFYSSLAKQVITFAENKTRRSVGELAVKRRSAFV